MSTTFDLGREEQNTEEVKRGNEDEFEWQAACYAANQGEFTASRCVERLCVLHAHFSKCEFGMWWVSWWL